MNLPSQSSSLSLSLSLSIYPSIRPSLCNKSRMSRTCVARGRGSPVQLKRRKFRRHLPGRLRTPSLRAPTLRKHRSYYSLDSPWRKLFLIGSDLPTERRRLLGWIDATPASRRRSGSQSSPGVEESIFGKPHDPLTRRGGAGGEVPPVYRGSTRSSEDET